MKRFIGIVAVFLLSIVFVSAEDAAAIMNKAQNSITSDTVSIRSRMVITAKDGTTSELMIDEYSKDGPKGSRMVIIFQKPATIAGTRFLSMDNGSGGTDQWMYLPGLGKVRRLAATESSGSFMGTDFSYDDIASSESSVDKFNYTVLREEIYNGHQCYVIQAIPKNKDFQYAKTTTWVDKEHYLIYRTEMYNNRNELVKTMESSKYENIQGQMTAMQIKVSTIATTTFTTIYMDIVKYNNPIPESVFTTRFLETGRVR